MPRLTEEQIRNALATTAMGPNVNFMFRSPGEVAEAERQLVEIEPMQRHSPEPGMVELMNYRGGVISLSVQTRRMPLASERLSQIEVLQVAIAKAMGGETVTVTGVDHAHAEMLRGVARSAIANVLVSGDLRSKIQLTCGGVISFVSRRSESELRGRRNLYLCVSYEEWVVDDMTRSMPEPPPLRRSRFERIDDE